MVRMPDCLHKKLLYGELQVGNNRRADTGKYIDTLKHCCIDSADWENVATNCSAKLVELLPISKSSECMLWREAFALASWSLIQPCLHQCQQCNRCFRTRIGLISHLQTHSKINVSQCGLHRLRRANSMILSSLLCDVNTSMAVLTPKFLWHPHKGLFA
jgi:hypothetical protein